MGALHRRLAAFDHIGQQRHPLREALAGNVHLLWRAQGFNKEGVDTAGQVGIRPVQRGIQALDGQRVGASQDQGLLAVTGVECGVQLAAHLAGADH